MGIDRSTARLIGSPAALAGLVAAVAVTIAAAGVLGATLPTTLPGVGEPGADPVVVDDGLGG